MTDKKERRAPATSLSELINLMNQSENPVTRSVYADIVSNRLADTMMEELEPKLKKSVTAWTDYPIDQLGDEPNVKAPVRDCLIISYDGDKYCTIIVENAFQSVKTGYLYSKQGRYGEVPKIDINTIQHLVE